MHPGINPQNGSFQKDHLKYEMVREIFWNDDFLENFLKQAAQVVTKIFEA